MDRTLHKPGRPATAWAAPGSAAPPPPRARAPVPAERSAAPGRAPSSSTYSVAVADLGRPLRRRSRPAPRRRGSSARRLAADHDRLGLALRGPPRRCPAPTERARTTREVDVDRLVLLADLLRPLRAPRSPAPSPRPAASRRAAASAAPRPRRRGRAAAALPRAVAASSLCGRQPPGGADDVVVELGPEDGHEDACGTRPRAPAWSAPARSPRPAWSGSCPRRSRR